MPTLRHAHRIHLWPACAVLVASLAAGGSALHAAPGTVTVEAVQVPAWVERNGQRSPAQPGLPLRPLDKAFTAAGSRMRLRMDARSAIKLGEQTELQVRSLDTGHRGVAEPGEHKGTFKLATGVFRYVIDDIDKALWTRRDLHLELGAATVVMRGTDVWSTTNADQEAACVFDGKAEVVRDGKPRIALDKPGALWIVYSGEPEKPADQATPAQWTKFIAQSELQAGNGVLLPGGRWRTVAALLSSPAEAAALQARLQVAGYPAETKTKGGRHEVRINQLATRADAEAVLQRLKSDAGLDVTEGRVALAAQ